MTLIAAFLGGLGLAMVAVGFLSRVYDREQELADILDLPYGETDLPIELVAERSSFVEGTVNIAGSLIEQVDAKGTLRTKLERARMPVRPGEYVIVVAAGAILLGAIAFGLTASAPLGVAAAAVTAWFGRYYLDRRITKRLRKLEEQLPDAISLIAGSLSAGHTFLRAIQMMVEEAEDPIREELARVVSETALGSPLMDALDRMSARLDQKDLEWVVQAIKIQQTVGGKLSDLLHKMADFIRGREEIRREVKALTAEGMASGYLLGIMPFALAFATSVVSPGYLDPLFQGKGWIAIGYGLTSLAIGFKWIMSMVKIEI